MSQVRVHNFSISLDGFGTGDGITIEAPFGHAGERLHEWMFATRFWHSMVGESGGTSGVDDLDVRIGGGPTVIRDFLAANLIDTLHVVQVPILLGRGVRLWDGLEGLEQQYDVEVVSTPRGVTHLTFTR